MIPILKHPIISYSESCYFAVLQRLAVRKRSIIAMGYLVTCCNNVLFEELLGFLQKRLDENKDTSTTRTYIQVNIQAYSFCGFMCIYIRFRASLRFVPTPNIRKLVLLVCILFVKDQRLCSTQRTCGHTCNCQQYKWSIKYCIRYKPNQPMAGKNLGTHGCCHQNHSTESKLFQDEYPRLVVLTFLRPLLEFSYRVMWSDNCFFFPTAWFIVWYRFGVFVRFKSVNLKIWSQSVCVSSHW